MNTEGEIILYQSENSTQVEVRIEKETVWLTLNQMSELFERDKSVISRHIRNIFDENELDRNSVVAKNATTEFSCNSPLSKTFFIWREIVDLSR